MSSSFKGPSSRSKTGTANGGGGQGKQDRKGSSSNSKSKQASSSSSSQATYTDIIDKLDLSGLGVGFHHSGPFDAANAHKKGRPPPIGAFSKSALDPTYAGAGGAGTGGDPSSSSSSSPPYNRSGSSSPNQPLRESQYHHQPRVNNNGGGGGGDGISARAKATLAAMGDASYTLNYNDGHSSSSENLLAGLPRANGYGHGRRNSESSITLGYPTHETNDKERAVIEAFGVHSEAYLDYGNSRYARQAPRASVAPSPNESTTSFGSASANGGSSSMARPGLSVGKMTRADRTASIWDIEATLREGRPVGAAPPPPMPIIPDRFLAPPISPSNGIYGQYNNNNNNTSGEGGVKRSKSLLARMRTKKGAMISNPSPQASPEISSGGGAAGGGSTSSDYFHEQSLPYNQAMQRSDSASYDKDGAMFSDSKNPFDNSAAVAVGASPDYHHPHHQQQQQHQQNGYHSRSTRRSMGTDGQGEYLSPTSAPVARSRSDESGQAGHGSSSAQQQAAQQQRSGSAGPTPRRSPQPPSPLGLPEADVFGSNSNSNSNNNRTYGMGMKSSMSRSAKHADLAAESATAAILAESSSKESGMSMSKSASSNSNSTSSSGFNNTVNASNDLSFASTLESDKTSTPDRSGGGGGTGFFGRPRGGSASAGNGTNANANLSSSSPSSSNNTSPADSKLARKPSLASRLLRGKTKRNS